MMAISLFLISSSKVEAKAVTLNSNFLLSKFATSATVADNATTVSGIQFKENEFVRITQPTIKDTFESQINIIGEARINTAIKIKVIYPTKEGQESQEGKEAYKIYELKEVGVTQTFNQLIDLEVGENTVVISVQHKDSEDIPNKTISITRKSEQTKDELAKFKADGSAILNAISPETKTTTKTTTP